MRKPSEDEWKQLVAEYRASPLTQRAFALEQDVSLSTFRDWLYRRARSASVPRASGPAFVPLEVYAAPVLPSSSAMLEAVLPGGLVVRFAAGTDVGYLADVVARLA